MSTAVLPRSAPMPPPALVASDEGDVMTNDGTPIATTFYAPVGTPRGAVLIVPAMGVPQAFYAPFATWLATQGHHVATFDYRGMGKSRRRPLARVDADILTWARQDTATVVRAFTAHAGGVPLTWIGHSLGGQLIPFVDEHRAAAKILTIATGSGYWRQNAAQLRRKVWIFWWLAVPLATPLFGYFPGKRLGMVGDLPKGVVMQWRRWCLQPDYAAGDDAATRALFANVTTPITSLSFTDDEMMSEASIASLHGLYASAPRKLLRISPTEHGRARIGHFGFFRDAHRDLWERLVGPELA